MKCAEDPVYFAENYIKIVHVDHGLVPMDMYEYQKEIIAMVNKINKSYFDGRSSGIICDGLADIFTALGNSDDPKILKEIDPKG